MSKSKPGKPQGKKSEKDEKEVQAKQNVLVNWMKSLGPPVAIFLLIRAMLLGTFKIPSGSMENTLLIGDFLFANKALYGAEIPFTDVRLPAFREPELNDLVVFDSVEEPGRKIVKRIVGMPGDTLAMEDNYLIRNGTRLDEPWVIRTDPADNSEPRMRIWQLRYYVGTDPDSYYPSRTQWGPIAVPADSFFVMGDNRDNSYDSRFWGFLGRDRIEARPMLVYYSFNRDGVLPLPAITSIRWSRIFSTPE